MVDFKNHNPTKNIPSTFHTFESAGILKICFKNDFTRNKERYRLANRKIQVDHIKVSSLSKHCVKIGTEDFCL
jgi:hypothetical protein